MEDSDAWEMGNKQGELEHCRNFLPGESSKAAIHREKTQTTPEQVELVVHGGRGDLSWQGRV